MFKSVFFTTMVASVLSLIFWVVGPSFFDFHKTSIVLFGGGGTLVAILSIYLTDLFERNFGTKSPSRQIALNDIMRESDAR